MDFMTLYERVTPRLRRVARTHNGHGFFISEDDLFQEMSVYLWENFSDGMPEGLNENYIVRGCEFHLLNYLRKKGVKQNTLSLDQPVNDDGETLEQILSSPGENQRFRILKQVTLHEINENGFTRRERQVFTMLFEGYTLREIGKKLGISHVMVIKVKKKITDRCRKELSYLRNFQVHS